MPKLVDVDTNNKRNKSTAKQSTLYTDIPNNIVLALLYTPQHTADAISHVHLDWIKEARP